MHILRSWLYPYVIPWLLDKRCNSKKSEEEDHEIFLSTKKKNWKQFCISSKRAEISAKIMLVVPTYPFFIHQSGLYKKLDEFGRLWGTTRSSTGWLLNLSYWDKCSVFTWIDQHNLWYLAYSQKFTKCFIFSPIRKEIQKFNPLRTYSSIHSWSHPYVLLSIPLMQYSPEGIQLSGYSTEYNHSSVLMRRSK